MNKPLIYLTSGLLFLISTLSCSTEEGSNGVESQNSTIDLKESIYQFSDVKTLDGGSLNFSKYKGKKILIVNTASKCGYTHQYKDLQDLYSNYKDSGFEIVGFPTNDFNQQEPGSDKEIEEFCHLNYGVTFQMMSKIVVKGENCHPVYKFLKSNSPDDKKTVNWNFQKYLIGEEGKLEKVIQPEINPQDSSIINWIEN